MRLHPLLLLFPLLALYPSLVEAQETPRELNSLPTAPPPAQAPAPTAPRQLGTAPVVPDSVRQQQRQRQMAPLPAETTRFAVGLKSGQVLRAYDVEVKQPVFGRSFLLVDGLQRYDMSDVRYYDDETGHYVRTTLPKSRRETTLRRDRAGRISLYSITSTQYAGNGFGYPYGGYGGFGRYGYGGFGPSYRTVKTEYFSKDNGPVENLTIRNLAIATADNAGSSALLAKARNFQRISTLSYVAAGGVILAGLFTTLNPNSAGPSVSPLVYAGLPLLIVPLIVQGKQQTSIRQAIALYNRGL
ncbi:hypothetical protein [Hymenobacter sp. GOD-10R]|uniref:hypothetical protein n=1 Tax=Hymenobacter sp. GOD-10R TaxID=3093922 RepID=UPI002D76CC13|nr:hypothetical protein [Hymenobacter sp. GOD-10R]WRQ27540.1 hypothetical protein SD425_20945 [Hymenobacter sp. GOD-10R]